MTSSSSPSKDATPPDSAAESLPALTTPLAPAEAMDRLATASKHGRLADFERVHGSKTAAHITLNTGIYDYDLSVRFSPLTDTPNARSCATFDLAIKKRLPLIMLFVVVISFWPGLPLTDTMLRQYFLTYNEWPIETWWWYIPLVVISIPPLWWQYKSSVRKAHKEAAAMIKTIAGLIDSH